MQQPSNPLFIGVFGGGFLPKVRTFLPKVRTFLPKVRTFLPKVRTKKPPFSCSSGRREFSHKGTQNRPFLCVFSQRYAFSHKGTQNYPFSPKFTRFLPKVRIFAQRYAFSPGEIQKREAPLLRSKEGPPQTILLSGLPLAGGRLLSCWTHPLSNRHL